jgi:ABC-type transport system substrate-binding protein
MASAPECGGSYAGEIKAIDVVDDYTVKFTLCWPDPAFLLKIAHPAFGILPREFLESSGGGGEGSPLLEYPVGTGPYKVNNWQRGVELVLGSFDNYWGEPAPTANLVIRWDDTASGRLAALQNGSADGIDSPDPGDYAAIQSDPSLTLIYRPGLSNFFIGLNTLKAPFNDQRVRQAIAMSLFRGAIIERSFSANAMLANYFTPCTIPFGCVGDPWYEPDVDKARALLAEAGYPDGFTVQLAYRNVVRAYLPDPVGVANEIQSQLVYLNVTVEPVEMNSSDFFNALRGGDIPGLYLYGWIADYPDASDYLNLFFENLFDPQFGDDFPELKLALENARYAADSNQREESYIQANNLIKEYALVIPVATEGSTVAYRSDVVGGHASPLNFENFARLSIPGRDTLFWLDVFEPGSLYCADETDVFSLRACSQVIETLLRYSPDGVDVQPALAETWEANVDLTEWTFTLRQGVHFHDGSLLDANDVVLSFLVQWDASHPLHKGNSGGFTYWPVMWGDFMNK